MKTHVRRKRERPQCEEESRWGTRRFSVEKPKREKTRTGALKGGRNRISTGGNRPGKMTVAVKNKGPSLKKVNGG